MRTYNRVAFVFLLLLACCQLRPVLGDVADEQQAEAAGKATRSRRKVVT